MKSNYLKEHFKLVQLSAVQINPLRVPLFLFQLLADRFAKLVDELCVAPAPIDRAIATGTVLKIPNAVGAHVCPLTSAAPGLALNADSLPRSELRLTCFPILAPHQVS
jgi:hypothetical protein